MATSLGYVLMNWTSTLTKKQRQRKNNKKTHKEETPRPQVSSVFCQTIESECETCLEKAREIQKITNKSDTLKVTIEELKKKLNAANFSLATTMEKESYLRNSHEALILEEAQVRYELNQLHQDLAKKLEERDLAHADRVRLLEMTMNDKECEWARKNEALRKDLRLAIKSSIQDTEREAESLDSLDQEIDSLKMVIEMRSTENRELRVHNNELVTEVERLAYLQAEMSNARHRLDEMTLVLQNKIDSERELLELSETLQSELVKSRAESMQLRKNLENRQFLHEQTGQDPSQHPPPLKVQHSHSDLVSRIQAEDPQKLLHRNQHQQASSGNKDKNLIMNVREKTESVAWMIQMPTSVSPTHQKFKI